MRSENSLSPLSADALRVHLSSCLEDFVNSYSHTTHLEIPQIPLLVELKVFTFFFLVYEYSQNLEDM